MCKSVVGFLALLSFLLPLHAQEKTVGPTNGDFESGLSYWSIDEGNAAVFTGDVYSGSKACRVQGFSMLASLVQNGGFESNWTGWPDKAGAYAIGTPAYAGSKACKLSGFSYAANLITNGGFESNWTAWPVKVGNYSLSTTRRSGSYSCKLAGQASAESGVNSNSYAVSGGSSYLLTSYVLYQSGSGNYKVTIAWLNASGGVIRYDNDWKGTNKPSSFTYHGGTFTAPTNAVSAVILLGVSAGTTFLFDDVALQLYQSHESSVTSAYYAAVAGKSYQLNSYVKYVSGSGNYKVTIAWLNASGGVIRYDNDWKGTNRPASYAYHGGWFTAPANTAQVRVILGVAPASVYLFDAIELIPQGTLAAASVSSARITDIVPGQIYKLSGYVKYLMGTGKYKISLGWYDENLNLIRYDNDWAGTDKPAAYTRHGSNLYLGISGADGFLPPDNAKSAILFFGVEPGVEALFDKITLTTADSPEVLYLQNEYIKVGVMRKFGGAIFYLADMSDLNRNYVNYADEGKLVQQSFWGKAYEDEPDIFSGGDWTDSVWNPCQGGNQKFNPELNRNLTPGGGVIRKSGNTIYSECYPLSFNQDLRTKTQLKTEITLLPGSRAVKIVKYFKNRDPRDRVLPNRDEQESICAYVTADLKWFKTYHGSAPFTSAPLQPNPDLMPLENCARSAAGEVIGDHIVNYEPAEYWAAWVNDGDFGVGIFNPRLQEFAADPNGDYHASLFRVGDANGIQHYSAPDPLSEEINYVALWPHYAMTANLNVTETTYLILDSLENIRSFVYQVLGYSYIPQ